MPPGSVAGFDFIDPLESEADKDSHGQCQSQPSGQFDRWQLPNHSVKSSCRRHYSMPAAKSLFYMYGATDVGCARGRERLLAGERGLKMIQRIRTANGSQHAANALDYRGPIDRRCRRRGVAVAADPPSRRSHQLNIKLGLWEIATQANISGAPPIPEDALAKMSPEQRAHMQAAIEASMAEVAKPRLAKHRVTQEKVAQGFNLDRQHDSATWPEEVPHQYRDRTATERAVPRRMARPASMSIFN